MASAPRVLTLTVVDQGASSLSNFALAVLVAHYSGARALGIFALLTTTYILGQGLVRSVTSDCLLTRSGSGQGDMAECDRAGYLAAFVGASALAALFALIGAAAPADFGLPLEIFALCFPLMALQDFSRFIGIARYDPAYAIRLDLAWLLVFVAGYGALDLTDHLTLPWLWGAWTASGALVGLTTLRSHAVASGYVGRLRWWLERERAVGIRFAGQFMLVNSWAYFIFYLLAFIVSLEAVGALKLAQLAIGPLTVAGSGVQSALVAIAARRFRDRQRRTMQFLLVAAALTAAATLLWTVFVYALPAHTVSKVLGPAWPVARHYVLPIGLGFALGAFSAAASAGLRARRAARENLWLAVATLPVWFLSCVIGAAVWGAGGFSVGFALAFAVASCLGWFVLVTTERRLVSPPRTAQGADQAPTHATIIERPPTWSAPPRPDNPPVPAARRGLHGRTDTAAHTRKGERQVTTMEPRDESSSLREYTRALWRRRVVVGGVTAAVVLAGVLYLAVATPKYQGTAQLLLTPQLSPALLEASGSYNPVLTVDVPSDIEVIESSSVANLVKRTLPHAPSVTATQVGTTNVVSVTAQSSDATLAAAAATAYANAYIKYQRAQTLAALGTASARIQSRLNSVQTQISSVSAELSQSSTNPAAAGLESELATLQGSLEAQANQLQDQLTTYSNFSSSSTPESGQLISAATVPTSAASPKPAEILAFALILGLILGVGAAMALEFFDDAIRSTDDLERVVDDKPVLGLVPDFSGAPGADPHRLVSLAAPESSASEAYRTVRTSLQFFGLERSSKTVQFTSPSGGEGTTSTLANVAVAMARAGYRVVAVDCDLRNPDLHRYFGLSNDVGFTSVLLGAHALEEIQQPVPGFDNLRVVASGPQPPNPSELLAGSRADSILTELAAGSDIVLVDSPAVLPLSDAATVAGRVDAVVMVVQVGTTTRNRLARSLRLLAQVEVRVLGITLNRASETPTLSDARHARGPRHHRGSATDNSRQPVRTGGS